MLATRDQSGTINDGVIRPTTDVEQVLATLNGRTGERASAKNAALRLKARLETLQGKNSLFKHISLSSHALEVMNSSKAG